MCVGCELLGDFFIAVDVRDILIERMQERKVEELANHLLMLLSLVS